MKKTIKINLGGIIFHIDEDAYSELGRIDSLSNDPGDLKRMHYAKAVANVDIGNFERAIKEINDNNHNMSFLKFDYVAIMVIDHRF